MLSLRAGPARLVFLAFLCVSLFLAYLSFERKIDSFSSIDAVFKISRAELEVLVPPSEAAPDSIPLHAGDRIVLIDGAPVASLSSPVRTLSRPPYPHRLAVVRGESVISTAVARPATRVDFPYLFLSFVGILYLFIGVATFSREQTPVSVLFAAFCTCSFAINLITPSGPVDALWKTMWLAEDVYRAFAPALLLHLFLLFPRPARRRFGMPWSLYAAPALYLCGEIVLSLPHPLLAPRRLAFAVELIERFWLLYFAAYAAASILRIVVAAKDASDAASQRQARWVSLGCVLGLSPFLVLYALPRVFGWSSPWAACAGVVPLVFVPLGFAYAILKWRLWDVDIFAREAAATTAAVFLGAASFVIVNELLNRALTAFATGAKNFVAFGSGLLIASLLVPVKRRLSDAIERFQYGETYRARRALLDFSKESRGMRDAGLLAATIEARVAEALEVAPCRFLLFDRELPSGLSSAAISEKLGSADSIRIRSGMFPSGEDLAMMRLHQDGFRHLFAVRPGGRLAGVLAVGLKEGGIPLSSEDSALISTVLSQASLAFENVELYRALERQMGEIASRERLASLGTLAAGVAHEVNTPLTGISSYAQLLLADTDRDDPRYEILKKMERQTFRASRLVGDLLDRARGRRSADEPMDLARTVRDALESAEPALAQKKIRVETAGLSAPLPMSGSSREIEQVLVNLLINARDASPESSVIRVEARVEPGLYIVTVADDGPGISEDAARRAFEPFFTTRKAGGTGLGLSIAREIVERHGGEISLSGCARGGAMAVVRLPR